MMMQYISSLHNHCDGDAEIWQKISEITTAIQKLEYMMINLYFIVPNRFGDDGGKYGNSI